MSTASFCKVNLGNPGLSRCVPAFNSLVVMAVDAMLRRANGAQAGIQRLHDQALFGAERSRVGVWLGLGVRSKPDANLGTRSGESFEGTGPRLRQVG